MGSEYYINGLSTSLPIDVQKEMIHSIAGLENAKLLDMDMLLNMIM